MMDDHAHGGIEVSEHGYGMPVSGDAPDPVRWGTYKSGSEVTKKRLDGASPPSASRSKRFCGLSARTLWLSTLALGAIVIVAATVGGVLCSRRSSSEK